MDDMDHDTQRKDITICFWNILSDVNVPSLVSSQSERLTEIIPAIKGCSADIVGLAEVEPKGIESLGKSLVAHTKYFVSNHRKNSQIGIFSGLDLKPTTIEINDDCYAVAVKCGGINIVFVHLTLILIGDKKRRELTRSLLGKLEQGVPTIIMGDFNSMYWQGSRKLFKQSGFQSALRRSLFRRLPTAPTRLYRKILPQPLRMLSYLGFTLDDIYTKDVEVTGSRIFEGESDHRGLVLKVQVPRVHHPSGM